MGITIWKKMWPIKLLVNQKPFSEKCRFRVCLCVNVFTQPLHHKQDVTQRQCLKRSTAGLNSEFFISYGYLIKAKEQNLPCYLRRAVEINRCFSHSTNRTQRNSSRIWVVNSISFDDDRYVKCVRVYMRHKWQRCDLSNTQSSLGFFSTQILQNTIFLTREKIIM